MAAEAWLLVYTVLAAGSLSVLWFFQVRRSLIQRMKRVVEILEEELRPRDKTYTLLGYLVGFRAVYKRPRGGDRAWILYTQPPRHVLLYLPIIHLLGERERLEVTIQARGLPGGEAHLYDPRDRATRRLVARDATPGLRREQVEVLGRAYTLLHDNDPEARSLAITLAEALAKNGAPPLRVTIHGGKHVVHIALEPRLTSLRAALRTLPRTLEKLQRR